MALGRSPGGVADVARRWMGGGAAGPKASPQHFTVGLQRLDVLAWTHNQRAAELTAPQKRMRTYLGGRRPSFAERLPPSPLPEEPNYRRVRETIVARSRLLARPVQGRTL